MKFKVGEKYKVGSHGPEHNNIIKITDVDNEHAIYTTVKGKWWGKSIFDLESAFAKSLVKVNETIVIYHKGNEVIALDKSTGKKAVAKCSPDDTFDFELGAKIAFDRLTGRKEKLDKSTASPIKGNFSILCTKSYEDYIVKGKLYTFKNGFTTWSNGEGSCRYVSAEQFISMNPSWKNCFVEVKPVKRRAKVGEYILVVDSDGNSANDYKNGDVLEVASIDIFDEINEAVRIATCAIYDKEYVVLEGYKPVTDKIKIGDNVKVINEGKTYNMYDFWKGLTGYESHFVSKKFPVRGNTYKVLNVAEHNDSKDMLALIQNEDTTQVFIVGIEGLEKC